AGRAQIDGGNPPIDFRLPQVVDDRSDGGCPNAAQIADDVGRRDFREIAADAQRQHRVPRHRRLPAEEQIETDKRADRHDDSDGEKCEDDRNTASSHRSSAYPFMNQSKASCPTSGGSVWPPSNSRYVTS